MRIGYVLTFLSFVLLLSLMTSAAVCADEIRFEATVSRNIVSLGQSLQLSLAFQGNRDVPAPDLPDIDGFQARYVGPSTMMSIVNGRMSSSVTHMYRLIPIKTGKFGLGPFTVNYKGDTYVSNSLTVEVMDPASGQTASPHSQQDSKGPRTSLKDRLFLTMETGKTEVYLNEIVPLTIKLYISSLSVRDIQYPKLSHEGFLAEQFGKPNQYQENRSGILYDVVEFKTEIFGTSVGEFSLGPAALQANLVMKNQDRRRSSPFGDFFGRDPFDEFFGSYRTEPVELKAERLAITVLPLPMEGRPSDFQGALGRFEFDVEASPSEVKTGDPLTLRMTVSGSGNFNTVSVSGLKESQDFKVYEPQVTQSGDTKIFEQILIPINDNVKEIPPVSFSFFNTAEGRYRTISKGPVPITVARQEMKEGLTILEPADVAEKPRVKEMFGRDIIYIKDAPGRLRQKGDDLYKNYSFLLLQTVPLLLFISAWFIKRRREKLSSDVGYARRLSAPRKARKGIREAERLLHRNLTQEFYDTVFRTLREYIGDRFHLPSGGITADIADSALKEKGVDAEILLKLRNIFGDCDMARYAPSELSTERMKSTFQDLKEVIDHLERAK